MYYLRRVAFPLFVLLLSFAAEAHGATFQTQPGILYTGVSNQDHGYQQLGTGYDQYIGGVFVDTYSGNASSTITLEECTSSAYSTCTIKATTGSITLISDTSGSASTTVDFMAPYQMDDTKYYQLYFVVDDDVPGFRFQCGNSSAQTPITGGDATPSTFCNAGSARSIYYGLFDAPITPTSTTSTAGIIAVDTSSDATGIIIAGFLIIGLLIWTSRR